MSDPVSAVREFTTETRCLREEVINLNMVAAQVEGLFGTGVPLAAKLRAVAVAVGASAARLEFLCGQLLALTEVDADAARNLLRGVRPDGASLNPPLPPC